MKLMSLKIISLALFFGMLIINYLANSLPFNGNSTGDISAKYRSFFTPAGITFSIWGIIYTVLGIYLVYILVSSKQVDQNILYLFIISSFVNIAWLFAWHYDKMLLSTIIMIIFIVVLGMIVHLIPNHDTFDKVTFSLYFAWINIALVANISILLVSLNIPIFQNNETLWYIIILIIGVIICGLYMIQFKNVVYGIVFIWAYFGILLKHLNKSGHYLDVNNAYILNIILILVLLSITGYTFIQNGWRVFPNT